jgi:uncharacterized protein
MAIGLSYPLMSLAIMAQYGIIPGRSLPQLIGLDLERAASTLLVISLISATFLTTALHGGRPAVKVLLRRIVRWRVRPVWWLVAVIALPTSTVILAVAFGDSTHIPTGGVIVREVLSITIALLLVNLWEETAWAGFLQSRLEHRHNFFVAAALTAIPFAAVHVPLRIINGQATTPQTAGIAFLVLLVFSFLIRTLSAWSCVVLPTASCSPPPPTPSLTAPTTSTASLPTFSRAATGRSPLSWRPH